MGKKLRALRYYGGKSPHHRTGPWIASMLPYDRCYAEPFAGMLGVLLQRRKSKVEMVNDADGNLIAWWRAVRDHPKKFGRLVRNTPYCKDEYERAYEALSKGEYDDPLRRALDYHICIDQGFIAGTGSKGWRGCVVTSGERDGVNIENVNYARRISQAADRMRGVGIHNLDATAFLAKLSKHSKLVVYCDPPYVKSSDVSGYGTSELDLDALTDALKKCKGFAAVSGYKDDWDHLGWHRYELDVATALTASTGKRAKRTEVLWTNKPAAGVPKRSLL